MPGMSGLEVAEQVKAQRAWTPVVIITGYGTDAAEARAKAAGVSSLPAQTAVARDDRRQRARCHGGARAPRAEAIDLAGRSRSRMSAAETSAEIIALKNIALFLAAPFIGLAYIVLLPLVGLGFIAVLAGARRRPRYDSDEDGRLGR